MSIGSKGGGAGYRNLGLSGDSESAAPAPAAAYELHYHEETVKDLKKVPRNIQARILRAIQERLSREPNRYAERLRKSLSGLWKLRVGDFRVIFEIKGKLVKIWCIGDRNDVYSKITGRASWRE